MKNPDEQIDTKSLEIARIDLFASHLPIHPDRAFPIHGADAEIIPAGDGRHLAVTLDVLSEEIAVGLYREPETMGWILVQANLSDLAAAGAEPVGLVLAISLGPEWDGELTERLSKGISVAAASQGTHVLGGDLNDAVSTSLGACAIGFVDEPLVSRHGIRPGDLIYATGSLGLGNAMAAVQLAGHPEVFPEEEFRPVARLKEGLKLRPFVHAMMDTSDGLIATLDQLAEINGVSIELNLETEGLIHPRAGTVTSALGFPQWAVLFAEHGEYELIFSIGESQKEQVPEGAIEIGRATEGSGVSLLTGPDLSIDIDGARVRNLRAETGGDPGTYIQELLSYGAGLGLPAGGKA
jgi:thiamine-monophosphate kinase